MEVVRENYFPGPASPSLRSISCRPERRRGRIGKGRGRKMEGEIRREQTGRKAFSAEEFNLAKGRKVEEGVEERREKPIIALPPPLQIALPPA
ncbi:hypothetical protein SUGI_1036750 [Cryptomeria japonica]|nr:hypothetical protein SUGI_1036750 [Cryptomeria japonica]